MEMSSRNVMIGQSRRKFEAREIIEESLRKGIEVNFEEVAAHLAGKYNCSLRLAKEDLKIAKLNLNYNERTKICDEGNTR